MIWRTFKYILSGLLLLLAGLLAFMYFRNPDSALMLGLSGFFILLAAILWIDFSKPNRALAMFGLVIALGFAYFGFAVLTGLVVYPSECSGRRAFCDLLNFLYGIGGRPAASAPMFALAIVMVGGVIATLKRSRAA